jgi:hypothetical protein
MNDQPDDREWGLTRWGGILTERDVRRDARLPSAEYRYDHELPARDDIDRSLYCEFAAGDQATERLIQLARDKKTAVAETSREASQAKAESPDVAAEAGLMSDEGELAEEETHNPGVLRLPGARGAMQRLETGRTPQAWEQYTRGHRAHDDVDATPYERSSKDDQAEPALKLEHESAATGQGISGRPLRPEPEAEPG